MGILLAAGLVRVEPGGRCYRPGGGDAGQCSPCGDRRQAIQNDLDGRKKPVTLQS